MSKARAKPAPAPEPEAELQSTVVGLTERCDHLAQQLQVQNDILEEIRQELQYLVTNGIEIRETDGLRMRIPVLKAMARNPAGNDWGQHLVINHGIDVTRSVEDQQSVVPTQPSPVHTPSQQPSTASKPARPSGRLF